MSFLLSIAETIYFFTKDIIDLKPFVEQLEEIYEEN